MADVSSNSAYPVLGRRFDYLDRPPDGFTKTMIAARHEVLNKIKQGDYRFVDRNCETGAVRAKQDQGQEQAA